MRHTEVPEEHRLTDYLTLSTTQEKLDAFWNLIENNYEDEWRVTYSGAVVLVVDDAMLERVLHDNVAVAWFKFGSNLGGWDENNHRYFTSRPEWLKGLYTIEGIYAPESMNYIGGERTYGFEPED